MLQNFPIAFAGKRLVYSTDCCKCIYHGIANRRMRILKTMLEDGLPILYFFRLRCCQRAQWEIRAVATEMLRLCCQTAPALFRNAGPGCCCGGCTEGKMSCGKAKEVREKFEVIRNGEEG